MIRILFPLLTVIFIFSSCEKISTKVRDTQWYSLHNFGKNEVIVDVYKGLPYSSDLDYNQKIVRLSTKAEYLKFAYAHSWHSYNRSPLHECEIASTNFSVYDLYVIGFMYSSQDRYTRTGSSVKINKTTNTVSLNFKIATKVGGSGMGYFVDYQIVKIPKKYASYEIVGKMYLDEKNFLGGSTHDAEIDFTLY